MSLAPTNNGQQENNPPVVMVVDPDQNVQQLAGYFLKAEGYKIEYASSGKDAWEEAKKRPPDVMLLELIVPELNGLTLCRMLKSESSTQKIRVVILSSLSSERSIKAAQSAGADEFMSKPLEKNRLIEAVAKAINPLKDHS